MIIAAADGSSLSNPGPAGWAWYVDDDHWASGGWPVGTNNMGELMAVLDLLRQTKPDAGAKLRVLCDSQYVINSLTKWLPGWKRKGWRKADGQPVANIDLFTALDAELAGRDVQFEWVKGHAGHPMNEAADTRARAAATAYQQGHSPASGPGWIHGAAEPASQSAVQPALQRGLRVAPQTSPQSAPSPQLTPALFADAGRDTDPDTQPWADPELAAVVELERGLLTDAVRTDAARLRELLHPDFVEYTQSGRIWTRNRAVGNLGPLESHTVLDLQGITRVGPDAILLRWRSVSLQGLALHSSVWVRESHDAPWRLLFTQGTSTPA